MFLLCVIKDRIGQTHSSFQGHLVDRFTRPYFEVAVTVLNLRISDPNQKSRLPVELSPSSAGRFYWGANLEIFPARLHYSEQFNTLFATD